MTATYFGYRFFIYPATMDTSYQNWSVGDSFQLRGMQIVDLTQYFNGDQTLIDSITSWDGLVAYDPRFASYVEYNAGEVAGVQPQVKVTSKNLLNLASTDEYATTKTNPAAAMPELREGMVIKGFNTQTYIYPNTISSYSFSNDVLTVVSSDAGNAASYGVGFVFKCSPGRSFVISVEAIQGYVDVCWFRKDLYRASAVANIMYNGRPTATVTAPADAEWMLVNFRNNAIGTTKTYTKPMVCAVGAEATAYEPYRSAGVATSPVPLYGLGTATDSYDAVTGKTRHVMMKSKISDLTWIRYQYATGFYYFRCGSSPVAKSAKIIADKYIKVTTGTPNLTDKTITGYADVPLILVRDDAYETVDAWLAAVGDSYICYELAAPTEETLASSTISLQTGNNVALQTDGGRTSPFSLIYDGTEFTLPLDSAHKYAYSDNGTKSIITGSSEQAVTGGQDMLVDVTRMFNGDATAINAVTSWADMTAVMPEYLSNVAYNEGEVVGRSGGVTTAKWNQLVQNGNFADGTTGWMAYRPSYSTSSVENGVWTQVLTYGPTMGFRYEFTAITGHKYAASVEIKKVVFTSQSSNASSYIGIWTNNDSYGVTTANIHISEIPANSFIKRSGILDVQLEESSRFMIMFQRLAVGDSFAIRNAQLFDLTEIYGAGHEPSTVEEFEADCAKWGKDLAQYQPYDAGTPMGGSATFSDLHGVGDVKETLDIVTGEKQVKFGSVDLGILTWSKTTGNVLPTNSFYTTNLQQLGFYFGGSNNEVGGYVACSAYPWYDGAGYSDMPDRTIKGIIGISAGASQDLLIRDSRFADGASLKQALSGVYAYLPLAEPTTSTETPQPLTFTAGLNNVHEENMDIAGTPIDMEYTGTDYVIPTKSSRKYVKTIDGVTELVTGGNAVSVRGGRDNLIDLTRMFGAGLEPGTLDAFYHLFPAWRGYRIPYNKGSLLNFKGTGLKSVGFNLLDVAGRTLGQPQNTTAINTTVRGPFDESKYYVGFTANNYYIPSNVSSHNITATSIYVRAFNAYGIGFPIHVIPGQTYRIENFISGKTAVGLYTYEGKHLAYITVQSFTVPSNGYWAMMCFVPIGTNTTEVTFTNPCVHLQWTGTRNGDYEPYWSYTRPVPTLTYFPSGMNGRGDVYDEMNERNYVKRFGMVDLGTLNWTHSDAYGLPGIWTSSIGPSDIKKPASPNSTSDITMVASEYMLVPATSLEANSNGAGNFAIHTNGQVKVNNGSATEHPTGWLVYELATPVVTTYDESPNLTAQISDYGTEESLPANGYKPVTAPFSGVVLYASDYARTITKLSENYISKESMEALLALVGPLLHGTIGMTYNQSTGEYAFNFTANP
jgi:hypothetical protein